MLKNHKKIKKKQKKNIGFQMRKEKQTLRLKCVKKMICKYSLYKECFNRKLPRRNLTEFKVMNI